MGILVTAGAIGVMCVSGIVVSTVFTWFSNIEIDLPKKKKDKKDYEDNSHRARITNLKSQVKPTDI